MKPFRFNRIIIIGFVHTAFVFAYEGLIGRSSLKNTDIPPGALISFLQKGLQYLGIEENLNADGSERKKKKRKSSSKSSATTSGNPAEQNNNSDEESSASVPPTEPFTLLSPHARKAIGKREMPIRLNVPPASAAAAIRAKIAKDDAAAAAAAKAGRNAISSSQQQQSQLPPVLSSSSTSNSKSKPTKTLNAVSSEELTNKSNDSSSTGKVSSKSKKNSSNNNLAPPTMGNQQAPSLATAGGVGGPNNFHLSGQGLVPGGPGSSGASVPGQQQLWNAHDENQRVHALANVASGLSAAAAAAANAGSPFSLMPSGGVMSAQQQNNPQISMHNKFNPEHPPVDANKSNPSNTFGHPVMPTQQPHPDPKKEHNLQGPNNTTAEGTLAEYNQTQVLPHEILELRKHTSEVFMCSWNQTYPNLIATGSGDASARIWSMNGSTASAGCGSSRLLKHGDATDKNKDVTTLEWSPDGNYLATGSYDGVARVWTKVGDLVHTLVTHRGPIFSLKWNKRGNYLLSGSYDKTTIVWDVSGKEAFVKQQFNHHFAPALDVDWKDNDTFASCSTDKVVHVCRVGATNPLITFSGHTDEVNAVKWDPSGNLLASCSDDCTAKVWDVGRNHDSAPLFDFRSHQQEIYTVKW